MENNNEFNPVDFTEEVDYRADAVEAEDATGYKMDAVETEPAASVKLPEPKKPIDKRILISAIIGGAALIGIIALIIVLALGGKDKDKGNDKMASGDITLSVSPKPSDKVEPTATPEPTLSPTPIPVQFGYSNPMDVDGIEYFEDEEVADNIKYVAKLDGEAKIGDKYMTGIVVYSYNGEEVLVDYQLSELPPSELTGDMGEIRYSYIEKLSADSGEKIEYDFITNYLQVYNDVIVLEEYTDNATISTIYDKDLEYSHEFVAGNSETDCLTSDGIRRYCVREGKLFCEYKDASTRMVELEESILISYINGIITTDDGTDYICIGGEGADMKYYDFYVNGTTGEVVYIADYENAYSHMDRNTYVETQYDDETFWDNRWIFSRDEKNYEVNFSGEEYVNYKILDNGDVFFSIVHDHVVTVYIFSLEEGELIGLAEFEVTDTEIGYDYYGDEYDDIYLYDMPVDMGDGKYLLKVGDAGGNYFFYVWDVSIDEDVEAELEISEYVKGERPSVEITPIDDYEYLVNKGLSDELLPLKERADEIEELYGIDIFIGEECAGITGGYACYPLTDYETVEKALDCFEIEISRYPEDFFEQMYQMDFRKMEFYLCSTIKGVGDYGLDYAGGFQMEDIDSVIIYIDSEESFALGITLHHELFHAIEDYLNQMYYSDLGSFCEEDWDELNGDIVIDGHESPYTYSYSQFGHDGSWEYTYYGNWDSEDNSNVYFIDDYSMTYPHEDRARIFEWVMNPNASIDFDQYPHLEAKLNYMAESIRECFDTSEWEDVPWEAYLD